MIYIAFIISAVGVIATTLFNRAHPRIVHWRMNSRWSLGSGVAARISKSLLTFGTGSPTLMGFIVWSTFASLISMAMAVAFVVLLGNRCP